ncbi:ferrochelatase [Alcaligenaceae bacterium CGII-47]|nr:ferrochelatase [Alcaligenaceae bacterium CGII-47]
MSQETIGILIMAYGTPRNIADLTAYYTHIRRGNPPTEDLLQELSKRYRAIGGLSPLGRITQEQADKLAQNMNTRLPGTSFKSYVGFKHIHPFIEDAVESMHADGIEKAISIIMAPHYSALSTQSYSDRATKAAENLGMPTLVTISSWYRQPKFIAYWAQRIRAMLSLMSAAERQQTIVLFSAHSLPRQTLVADPYPQQVLESARLIAAAAGLDNYELAWQSAGRTSQSWLGPDILSVTRELSKSGNYKKFIYCPIGFVSDHLEILYDNDIECRAVTDELGAQYLRPAMPNTDDLFIAGLGDALIQALVMMEPAQT